MKDILGHLLIAVLAVVGVVAATLLPIAISWAAVVFILWLICLCFALPFNLLYATGVWLLIILVSSVFRRKS